MINKNELKVFNYFYLNDKYQPNKFHYIIKILTIELKGCRIETLINNKWVLSGFVTKYEYLEPIPITEEWLLKFGFVSTNGIYKFFRSAFYFRDKKCIYGILDEEGKAYYHVCEIDYIHQLQNLYFALTQKELIFNG